MKNNRFIGICKVGEKGQIVIPKEIRNMFEIKHGDSLVILSDNKKGIALVKSDVFNPLAEEIMKGKTK